MKKIKLLTSLGAVTALGGGAALTTTSCSSTKERTIDEGKAEAIGFIDAHIYKSITFQGGSQKITAGTYMNNAKDVLVTNINNSTDVLQIKALSSIAAGEGGITGSTGETYYDDDAGEGHLSPCTGIMEAIGVLPSNGEMFQIDFEGLVDQINKNEENVNTFISSSSASIFAMAILQQEAFPTIFESYRSAIKSLQK